MEQNLGKWLQLLLAVMKLLFCAQQAQPGQRCGVFGILKPAPVRGGTPFQILR